MAVGDADHLLDQIEAGHEFGDRMLDLPDKKDGEQPPGLFEAIAGSINITQDRITRSRMAGDPPDVLLSPKLAQIGLLEFYRANEAIEEGILCVQRMMPEIRHVFDRY